MPPWHPQWAELCPSRGQRKLKTEALENVEFSCGNQSASVLSTHVALKLPRKQMPSNEV